MIWRNFPVRTPQLIKWLYPEYIWDRYRETEGEKTIFLTFDDGPTPGITPWVLDQLKEHKAKATFFLVGNNAAQNPELVSSIIHAGHALGNHTYDHLNGWVSANKAYIENVEKAQNPISMRFRESDNPLKLFRPPYGRIKRDQGKLLIGLGFSIIMYDVLARDWDKRLSGQKCAENVLKNAKSGSIVVFHDSKKAEKNLKIALPKILSHFREKGFHFKKL